LAVAGRNVSARVSYSHSSAKLPPLGFAVLDEPDGQRIGLEPAAAADGPGLDPARAGRAGLPVADWAGELVEDRLLGV
jgi:hypothetical protein